VLSSRLLAATDDFTIRAVNCAGGHARWSAPEPCGERGVVLVRSGLFRLRNRGRELLAEPTMAYLHSPEYELQFAHPRGGDTCSAITFSADLWQGSFEGASDCGAVPVDARLELAHLLLLRATGTSDVAYAVAERLVRLMGHAVRAAAPTNRPGVAGTRLAHAAREAILADEPDAASLVHLARRLRVSPYHLSHTFTMQTGISLTRYRNRVRVSRALHRLHNGETNLARLAVELGFSDQAHLSRTVNSHVDQAPAAVRRLLTGTVIDYWGSPGVANWR
jgi:AraC-like DNA-binding protein